MLNNTASDMMKNYTIHACTDVTGFGLIGHLKEMLGNDNIEITLNSDKLPILPGAAGYASMGLIPGGMYRNRDYIGKLCSINRDVKSELADIIFDPQTSGGLLLGSPEAEAPRLLKELHSGGIQKAEIIAEVKSADQKRINVI